MTIGNTNIHIQYVSEYIDKLSLISVLWIFSCNELKWWKNYYFYTIIISNSQIEIPVSYSRSTNVNVNMSFPNSKFDWNFSTYVFGKYFVIIERWKLNVVHRDTYYAKNIKLFLICGCEKYCRKWNIY